MGRCRSNRFSLVLVLCSSHAIKLNLRVVSLRSPFFIKLTSSEVLYLGNLTLRHLLYKSLPAILPQVEFAAQNIPVFVYRKYFCVINCEAHCEIPALCTWQGFTSFREGIKIYFIIFALSLQDSQLGQPCTVKVDSAGHLIYWRAEDKVRFK